MGNTLSRRQDVIDAGKMARCRECNGIMWGIWDWALKYFCWHCGDFEEDEVPVPPTLKIVK